MSACFSQHNGFFDHRYKGVHDASWKITVLSVVEGEQFSEVEDFVQSTVKQ